LLHNIATTVPNWAKVESGLFKMYKVEVLQKVPVVQHFWFGGVLGWRRAGSGQGPGRGEELPSSGGVEEVEGVEMDEPLGRCGAEEVVAPWKLPALSGTTPPAASPTTRSPSTSSSSLSSLGNSYGRSTSSLSLGRQVPSPGPAAYAPTPTPKPFVPPALFPDRRRRSSLSQEVLPATMTSVSAATSVSGSSKTGPVARTVAEEGGAAASGSPFGVLRSATGGVRGGTAQEGRRAPWARE